MNRKLSSNNIMQLFSSLNKKGFFQIFGSNTIFRMENSFTRAWIDMD